VGQAELAEAMVLLRRPLTRAMVVWAVLALILGIAALLRFERLDELTVYLGDQGQHAFAVQKALTIGQLPSVGPPASTGTWVRGPAYYVLLMPAFLIGGGEPLAGAAFVAIVDLGTIVLLFLVGRRAAGELAGLVAAALWSVSPLAVLFGRFMWNPQLVPFFTLIAFYSLARVREDGRWIALVAVAWSLAWQSHDQALLVLPSLVLGAWLLRDQIRPSHWALAGGLFAVSLAPYIVHELRNGLQDVVAMANYILQGSGGPAGNTLSAPGRLVATSEWITASFPGPPVASSGLLALAAFGAFSSVWGARKSRSSRPSAVILWVPVPLLYVFWRGEFDAAYLLILYPLAALMAGIGAMRLARFHLAAGVAVGLAMATVITLAAVSQWQAIASAPITAGTLGGTRAVVRNVETAAHGSPFSFSVVDEHAEGPEFKMPRYWYDFSAGPYRYLFALGGSDTSARVDVPAYVAFHSSELGPRYPEGVEMYGTRIVGFPAPTLGANLLTQPDGGSNWESQGSQVQLGPDGAYLEIHGSPQAALAPDGVNVSTTVNIEPSVRYVILFQTRGAPSDGSQRAFALVSDGQGSTLTILPTGAGYAVAPSSDWTTGSFYVDAPVTATHIRVFLRNLGLQPVYFRDVQVRAVLSELIPGVAE
jgi:4-amino-4-deoxy-L-arabinose transferase and related glycosyltransferases of PMT family